MTVHITGDLRLDDESIAVFELHLGCAQPTALELTRHSRKPMRPHAPALPWCRYSRLVDRLCLVAAAISFVVVSGELSLWLTQQHPTLALITLLLTAISIIVWLAWRLLISALMLMQVGYSGVRTDLRQ